MEDFARPCITVRYSGPTNHRGAKLIARFGSQSASLSWNSALEPYENHKAAAVALAKDFDWDSSRLIGAHVRDANDKTTHYVFILS